MMERTTSQSSGYEPLPSSDKGADNAARLAHRATCGIHHLFRELRTGPDGLREAEAARRLQVHGPNVITASTVPSWYRMLWLALVHPFNCILLFLAATAYVTKDMATAAIMVLMVTVSTGLRFWQELKSTVAAAKLIELIHTRAKVVRRDEHGLPAEVCVEQRDVVPGDIVKLFAGELFPGDVRLLQAKDLFVGEAVLTGESMPAEKVAHSSRTGAPLLECRNLCFMGTHVVSGVGLGLVIATGGDTYLSSMAETLTQQRPANAFQRGVRRVSYLLIAFMAAMVPLVTAVSAWQTGDWYQAALFGISVAVGLTPEMLPMVVNANLARGAVALASHRVIVKQLDAVQNLGAMDVLCTDKTGTLTLNEVVLMRWMDWRGRESVGVLRWGFLNAYFQTGVRNLMDAAILQEGKAAGVATEAEEFEKIDELPFDFVRRRLSVILQQSGRALLVCKGAMEEVLGLCSRVQDGEELLPLEDRHRQKLAAMGEHLNVDGLRVLAVAVKEVDSAHSALSMAGTPPRARTPPPRPFDPGSASTTASSSPAPSPLLAGSSMVHVVQDKPPSSSGAAASAAAAAEAAEAASPGRSRLMPRTPPADSGSGGGRWHSGSAGGAEEDLEAGLSPGLSAAPGEQQQGAGAAAGSGGEQQQGAGAAAGSGGGQEQGQRRGPWGLWGGSSMQWSSRVHLEEMIAEESEAESGGEEEVRGPAAPAFSAEDEGDMVFVGFLAFLDPPKDSAAAAVRELHANSVSIKVLTGDNLPVARKVCSQVGIPTEHMLTGAELEKLSGPEFDEGVDRATVLAKLTPLQKAQVVAALKRRSHTVGFLGDGINDALALRSADVGVSVDTGTDIAKDAADVILLEKSLRVLEEGVLQGRATHGNTIKYIKMAHSSNFGNVFSILVASAWLPFQPMRPIQLLTQNLLYDCSQTAIPFDTMDPEYLAQPRTWSAAGIGLFMVFIGPTSSIFDMTTFALLWWYYKANSPERQALFQTGWFTLGLLTQTLIVHMIRTERVPFVQSVAAPPLIAATVVISLLGLALPYTPVGHVEGLASLPLSYYGFVAATVLAYAVTVQLAKMAYIKAFRQWL